MWGVPPGDTTTGEAEDPSRDQVHVDQSPAELQWGSRAEGVESPR